MWTTLERCVMTQVNRDTPTVCLYNMTMGAVAEYRILRQPPMRTKCFYKVLPTTIWDNVVIMRFADESPFCFEYEEYTIVTGTSQNRRL